MGRSAFPASWAITLGLVAACSSSSGGTSNREDGGSSSGARAGSSSGDGSSSGESIDGAEMTTAPVDGALDSETVMAPTDGGRPVEAASTDSACARSSSATAYDAIGTGTAASPYVLCTAAQVMSLATTPAAWKNAYRLGADVDMGSNGPASSAPFPTIGNDEHPFHGTFNGGGHVISNVRVSLPGASHVGFFGYLSGSATEVRSLTLAGGNVTGYASVGILAGGADRGARILGCATSGTVTGDDRVGGLLGSGSYGPVISSSRSDATVTATNVYSYAGGLAGLLSTGLFVYDSVAAGAVNGASSTGGLVGSTDSGAIYDSYSTAAVDSTDTMADGIGGFVGSVHGTIFQSCFATGDVTAAAGTTVGQFAGDAPYGTYTDDFVSSGASCTSGMASCGADPSARSAPVTQLQSRSMLPLSGWDFTRTWSLAGGSFPSLASKLFDETAWEG
ncbi:MAG: hypothetical protein ACRENE_22965, partial [Polyangiaceae bacterium]